MSRNMKGPDVQVAVNAFIARNHSTSTDKHIKQAVAARHSKHVTALRAGTPAQQIAHMILDLFPYVQLDNPSHSRTELATRTALRLWRAPRTPKTDKGVQAANDALIEAHSLVTNYRPQKLPVTH